MDRLDLGFKSMYDIAVRGKRVLLRVDINSPLDPVAKRIVNRNRLEKTVPTIQWLLQQGARVAIIAHQGDTDDYQNLIPLEEHARILSSLLGSEVVYVDDVCGPTACSMVQALKEGEAVLLGNLRYLCEEVSVFEKVVPLTPSQMLQTYLVRSLAPLFDVYINDAFSAAHRCSPSMVAFQEILPSAAGPLFFNEVQALARVMDSPRHPAVFVLGGARIGDAFGMMETVLGNGSADCILTCGVTGSVFLIASGVDLGSKTNDYIKAKSLSPYIDQARSYRERFPGKILMPIDLAYTDSNGQIEVRKECMVEELPPDTHFYDIGEKTIALYGEKIKEAGTLFVNGPAGVFEKELFEKGTRELWQAMAKANGYSVVGGGDSVNAATKYTDLNDWGYVCTAGGAMIQFLSGKALPLITAMRRLN